MLTQSKEGLEHKLMINLLKEKRDKNYIKNKLPPQHPAKLYLPLWDKLGLETEEEGDGCIVTLDINRIAM